jgi:hypothetical protein
MLPLDKHPTPKMGLAVITSDGAHLGTVRETSGSYFKVDAPMHKDYWLSDQLVKALDDAGVVLEVPKDDVAQYRRNEPGLEPGEDVFERIAGNAVLTSEEMLEQRANMERELAEQSRNLPPHEPSPTQMRGPRGYERIPLDHSGFGDLAGGYVPNAPVQDRIRDQFSPAEHGSKARMVIPVAAMVGLAAITAFVVMRRRRQRTRERIRDHAKAAARIAAERSRVIAEERGSQVRHMLARRGAQVAGHSSSFASRVQHRLERAA